MLVSNSKKFRCMPLRRWILWENGYQISNSRERRASKKKPVTIWDEREIDSENQDSFRVFRKSFSSRQRGSLPTPLPSAKSEEEVLDANWTDSSKRRQNAKQKKLPQPTLTQIFPDWLANRLVHSLLLSHSGTLPLPSHFWTLVCDGTWEVSDWVGVHVLDKY